MESNKKPAFGLKRPACVNSYISHCGRNGNNPDKKPQEHVGYQNVAENVTFLVMVVAQFHEWSFLRYSSLVKRPIFTQNDTITGTREIRAGLQNNTQEIISELFLCSRKLKKNVEPGSIIQSVQLWKTELPIFIRIPLPPYEKSNNKTF